jgi:Lrp/AsnC family transcriptional regulator
MTQILDDTDRRILRTLQKDATQSMDTLSERVSLSRNACWRRVKTLEDTGVIKGKVALVDPAKVGLELSALVMIKARTHDSNWSRDFHQAVQTMPEIVGAHRMSGDLDYVLRVRIGSVKDYDDFYKRLIAKVPIADISASFVMDDIKDTTELPL